MKKETIILIPLFVGIITIIAVIILHYNTPRYSSIDLNQDGRVDLVDYSIFEARFGVEKVK